VTTTPKVRCYVDEEGRRGRWWLSGTRPNRCCSIDSEAARPSKGALFFGFDVVLVTDLCVHGDDVALALGLPPNRDTAASRVALAGYCFGVDYRVRALDLPAMTLRYDGKERTLGEGPVAAVVTADRWELLRMLAGRRSRAPIMHLDWTGDPEPHLALVPAYGEREEALIENPTTQ
jgi:hypothetical protein